MNVAAVGTNYKSSPIEIREKLSFSKRRLTQALSWLKESPIVQKNLEKKRLEAEIIGIDTYGDKDKATPISQIEGTNFFTREIDDALLKGEIDFATSLRVNGERSRTIDIREAALL